MDQDKDLNLKEIPPPRSTQPSSIVLKMLRHLRRILFSQKTVPVLIVLLHAVVYSAMFVFEPFVDPSRRDIYEMTMAAFFLLSWLVWFLVLSAFLLMFVFRQLRKQPFSFLSKTFIVFVIGFELYISVVLGKLSVRTSAPLFQPSSPVDQSIGQVETPPSPASSSKPSDYSNSNLQAISSPTPKPKPQVTASPTSIITSPFLDRQFGKYFDKYDYPAELSSLVSNQLINMRCLPGFWIRNQVTVEEDGFLEISDNVGHDYKSFKFYQSFPDGTNIAGLRRCEDETDRDYYFYNLTDGSFATTTLTIVTNDSRIDYELPSFRSIPFFSCTKPLAHKVTGQLYLDCAGGDGALSHSMIVALDLASKQTRIVYHCKHDASDQASLCSNSLIPN